MSDEMKETSAGAAYSDEELLKWAHDNVRLPWERMCAAASAMARGEKIGHEAAEVAIPLTRFKADYRTLFPLMRDIVPLVISEPANLLTIITSSDGNRILRAYMERTTLNNFVSLEPVEPAPEWSEAALEMVRSGATAGLREFLNRYFEREMKFQVNWVKVANIRFFAPFMELDNKFSKGMEFAEYANGLYLAVKEVYRNGWIAFSPKPKVFARLEELAGKIVEYRANDVVGSYSGAGEGDKKTPRVVLALKGRDYLAAFNIDSANPYAITVSSEITDSYSNMGLKETARHLHKRLKPNVVIALYSDSITNLLFESTARPMPYSKMDMEILLRKVFAIIRAYPEQWAVYPVPVFLKWYMRLPKLLGLPYDITNLAYWMLPKLIVEGSGVAFGYHQRFALILLDSNKVRSVFIVEIYTGAVRRLETYPASRLTDIFSETPLDYASMKESLIKAKHRLWHEVGWVNFAIAVQMDLVRNMGKLTLDGGMKSIYQILRSIPVFRSLAGQLAHKQGIGLLIYPDLMIDELLKWSRKSFKHRISVIHAAIQVPFDRKGRRPRGLLFVKETIILCLLAAGAAAGVWALVVR